jgi:DNA-binding CsgD family transcriptional regulator/class 3 adenylate cyclase
MDRHDAASNTPELAAERHICDLDVQEKYGVRYLTYWYQRGKPTSFCLIDAPDSASASAVHREAHGRIATRIIEVERASVDAFLGPIHEPARGEAWEDISWRTVVCIALGEEMLSTSFPGGQRVLTSIQTRGGHELASDEGKIVSRYASTPAALECALAVQQSFAPLASVFTERSLQARIGIHRSEPVTQYLELFGEALEVASLLCDRAQPGEVLVTRDVRDACESAGFQFDTWGKVPLEDGGGAEVFRLLGRGPAAAASMPLGDATPEDLSRRELEVLQLIAAGKTNREIAEALVISLNTVATHVRSIFAKTEAANRAEAAIYALRHRLI